MWWLLCNGEKTAAASCWCGAAAAATAGVAGDGTSERLRSLLLRVHRCYIHVSGGVYCVPCVLVLAG